MITYLVELHLVASTHTGSARLHLCALGQLRSSALSQLPPHLNVHPGTQCTSRCVGQKAFGLGRTAGQEGRMAYTAEAKANPLPEAQPLRGQKAGGMLAEPCRAKGCTSAPRT